jgi:hypothetical protein
MLPGSPQQLPLGLLECIGTHTNGDGMGTLNIGNVCSQILPPRFSAFTKGGSVPAVRTLGLEKPDTVALLYIL